MDVHNETHAFVDLVPVVRTVDGAPTDDLEVAVVIKATYDLHRDGELTPARRRLPIFAEPLLTRFGLLGGDRFARKNGVDLCVLGSVRLARPVRRHRVGVRLGDLGSSLQIFGDRRWIRTGSGLGLGVPELFTEMPITYDRAFGGLARVDDLEVPYLDNPVGRGFYLEEKDAEGNLAPNVLEVGEPCLSTWSDRPRVAGWAPYPFFWGLRGARALTVDADARRVTAVSPDLHNHAHPSLVVDAALPGTPVRVEGMTPLPIAFDLPDEAWTARADIGRSRLEATASIDGVYIFSDADKVVVTRRAHFDATFRRGERRTVSVTRTGGP